MTRLSVERTAPNILTIRRRFAAPPALVWDAHMKPELVRQWCFGPEGWEMTRCDQDPRPGGTFRYDWRETATGRAFHATGEFVTIEPPDRIVHVERMFLPDPTPDNRVETHFLPDGVGTLLVMTMTVPDAQTIEAMLATGMTDGMEMSYARIDPLF